MTSSLPERTFLLEPSDSERLSNLAGPFDGHLRQIELRLGVEIANRGNIFRIVGRDEAALDRTEKLLKALYAESAETVFDSQAINLRLSPANWVCTLAKSGTAPSSRPGTCSRISTGE